MNVYDVGDQVRVTVAFASAAGAAVDPTAVVCTVRSPSSVLTPSVTNPSVGTYYSDVTITEVGQWSYRFTGTGALIAAGEGQFYARKSNVLTGPFEP